MRELSLRFHDSHVISMMRETQKSPSFTPKLYSTLFMYVHLVPSPHRNAGISCGSGPRIIKSDFRATSDVQKTDGGTPNSSLRSNQVSQVNCTPAMFPPCSLLRHMDCNAAKIKMFDCSELSKHRHIFTSF